MIPMGLAYAEDVVFEAKIQSATEATTRNGIPYTRVIIEENREKDGIQYTAGVPAMFFGDMASVGAGLKAGDTVKFIGNKRSYQGRDSYTVLKLLE